VDVEAEVDCGGNRHVVRWTTEGLVLLGHTGEREDDDVLVALSGEPSRCRVVEAAWNALAPAYAIELLDVPAEQLAVIAHRLPVIADQRERVRRRRDLTDEQRAASIQGFDQLAHRSVVASLGLELARRRGLDALRFGVARRGAARVAVGAHVARSLGAAKASIVVLPLGAFVLRVGSRAVGFVSPRWVAKATA
jgi:hypothetical protein